MVESARARQDVPVEDVKRPTILLVAVATFGCSTLIGGPYDSPSDRTAKAWKRAALGVSTLGLSEIWVGRRSRQYERHWTYWFDRLVLASRVESARTHEELTRVFGGIPECSEDGPSKMCQWTADSRTYAVIASGFRLYASTVYRASVVQSGGEFYRLICSLPADGSEREPGSCTHRVNDINFSETEFRICMGRWEAYCPRFEDVRGGTADRRWERSIFVIEAEGG